MSYGWQFTPQGMNYLWNSRPELWTIVSLNRSLNTTAVSDVEFSDEEEEDFNPAIMGFFHAIEHAEEAAEELQFPYEKSLAWAAIANAYAQIM